MSAATQVFANFSAPITPSRSISRFLSLPRWPSADSQFTFSTSYLNGNALTSLIPIIAGLSLTLLTLLHIIIRHTCRSVSTDARASKISSHNVFSRVQILLSALLLTAVAVFLSLGLLGNAALTFSANDALDVIDGLVADLSRLGFAFFDTALLMESRIGSFSVDKSNLPGALGTSLGDQITPTFETLRSYALDAYPDIEPLKEQLNILVSEIGDVLDVVSKIADIVYAVALTIMLLLAFAPLLLFLSDALSHREKRRFPWAHLIFLIPIVLAWILVGVVQSAGIVVSDVCESLRDYRTVLAGGTAPGNAFTDSGFTCPRPEVASEIRQRIRDTAAGITQSELARDTVELLLDEPSARVADAAEWSGAQAARLVNCSTQVDFSGKLEFIVCGKDGSSAVDGLFGLFVAFLGLALCLHLAISVGLFGVEVARHLFVWRAVPVSVDTDEGFETPSEGKEESVTA